MAIIRQDYGEIGGGGNDMTFEAYQSSSGYMLKLPNSENYNTGETFYKTLELEVSNMSNYVSIDVNNGQLTIPRGTTAGTKYTLDISNKYTISAYLTDAYSGNSAKLKCTLKK